MNILFVRSHSYHTTMKNRKIKKINPYTFTVKEKAEEEKN